MNDKTNTIKRLLDAFRERWDSWHQRRRLCQMRRDLDHDVNLREWNGTIYIAYCGEPLLAISKVSHDAPSTLAEIRDNIINFRFRGETFVNDTNAPS